MNNTGKLKVGYTTGSHAASAFKAALFALFSRNVNISCIDITLPSGDCVELIIDNVEINDNYVSVNVTKSDNDDIDVTKGCKISCKSGFNLSRISFRPNNNEHKPHILDINGIKIYIHAGKGLGIVTKEGLSAPVGYPAINPVPLEMMKTSAIEVLNELNITASKDIHIVFEVEDGDEIAKNTANFKAGIVGGISFIGKIGLVKPISTQAYLDSLKAEMSVAAKNESHTAILTMGNDSLKFAKNYYKLDNESFIEIGNYVYDTLTILQDFNISHIAIVSNTGKLTKLAQGKKNTNNRYGDIDFQLLKDWLERKRFTQNISEYAGITSTVRALEDFITRETPDHILEFYKLITDKALETLKSWTEELNLENRQIEIILTDGENLKFKAVST